MHLSDFITYSVYHACIRVRTFHFLKRYINFTVIIIIIIPNPFAFSPARDVANNLDTDIVLRGLKFDFISD